MAPPRRSAPGLARLVRTALEEDRVGHDRTTRAVLRGPVAAEGRVVAQAAGVLSGSAAARTAARALGLTVVRGLPDGAPLVVGAEVLVVRGPAARILAVERTVLNLLMHASGVATATARAVRAVRGSRPPLTILATRKTLPGLRDLEKSAVVDGGGRPHRRDLAAAILVKNNHLALVGLEEAVARARRAARPREPVEVEVRTRTEALRAARAGAAALLIDNATPARARSIVAALERTGLRRQLRIELSGGITPDNVGRYRRVGADAVSLGVLTHSAVALPFHLLLRPVALRRRRR